MSLIPRVVRFVRSAGWAILPEKLEEIVALIEDHAAGVRYSQEEIQARIGSRERPEPRLSGSVAVLPLHGVIVPRANVMSQISGGTSAESFASMFSDALSDPSVSSVVLDIDSPGGAVSGVPELAELIRKSRGSKPIVAVANPLAASAAYWIASAADRIHVVPSGMVGSIGVVAVHTDLSKLEEQRGVKTTLVTAGKYKAEESPYAPLTDEARAEMQARVNDYYGMFLRDVAAGRGISANDVEEKYGQGRVVGAGKAVRSGMANGFKTLDQVIAELTRQPVSR